jgi:hypothetical protein
VLAMTISNDAAAQWEHRVAMVQRDHELRRRTPEQWREDAKRRLQELEAKAAQCEQGTE